MAEEIRLVDYFYITAADRPGEGARALRALAQAGVNLLAFSGFPEGRRAQLDFVPADAVAFRSVARKAGWKLVGPKKAFLIQGEDRVGALGDALGRLADARINVIASEGVCAGGGRFGAILWVSPRDVRRAAKALGIG